jgi:hypothetical protein
MPPYSCGSPAWCVCARGGGRRAAECGAARCAIDHPVNRKVRLIVHLVNGGWRSGAARQARGRHRGERSPRMHRGAVCVERSVALGCCRRTRSPGRGWALPWGGSSSSVEESVRSGRGRGADRTPPTRPRAVGPSRHQQFRPALNRRHVGPPQAGTRYRTGRIWPQVAGSWRERGRRRRGDYGRAFMREDGRQPTSDLVERMLQRRRGSFLRARSRHATV